MCVQCCPWLWFLLSCLVRVAEPPAITPPSLQQGFGCRALSTWVVTHLVTDVVGSAPTPKTPSATISFARRTACAVYVSGGRPAFGYSLGCVVPRRNDCPVPIGCPFRAGPHRARGPWLSARRIVAASLLGGLLGHSGQSCTRVLMLHFPRPQVSAIEPTRLRAAFITYSLCPRVT